MSSAVVSFPAGKQIVPEHCGALENKQAAEVKWFHAASRKLKEPSLGLLQYLLLADLLSWDSFMNRLAANSVKSAYFA